MIPAAPPVPPEAHIAEGGPGLRAAWPSAVTGGLLAFLATAIAAQIVPMSIDVFGGGLAPSTALKLGWFYELAFHKVTIDVTGSGGATGRISLAFLSGTGFAIWVLFRAGRTAARRAGPSFGARVLAGAMVGPVYALPIAVITSTVRLQLHTGGSFVPETVGFHGVVWQAFALPALLGIGAGGAAGALEAWPRDSRGYAWLVGGWRALLGALGLAAIGVLVLAAARPQGTADYARVVSSNGPRTAALLLGHHALLVPNQSFFVLAPSMGGCTELRGPKASIPLLCPGRSAEPGVARPPRRHRRGSTTQRSRRAARPRIGRWPPATGCSSSSPRSPRSAAVVPRAPVGRAHASRSCEARAQVWCSPSWWASGPGWRVPSWSCTAAEGIGTRALTLGPRPLPTALLALAWGVAGGALGAWTRRQEEGTPVPVEPDEPVPPSPTSV